MAAFSGGDLAGPFENVVSESATGQFRNGSANAMTLTVTRANGSFSGTVTEPATGKARSFKGVLCQPEHLAAGFLKGAGTNGAVVIY